MAVEDPPAYAWDWLSRQRAAWREIRSRLLASQRSAGTRPGSPAPGTGRAGDVPDWSSDHPDLLRSARSGPPENRSATTGRSPAPDDRTLDTRAEVIAALRRDYASDAELRRIVDTAIVEVAFLGRLDVPLQELGVSTAPRGMRWWWSHLGGPAPDDDRSELTGGGEPFASLPVQLRLVDVLSGYGDVREV
jgi:hypothetical protein